LTVTGIAAHEATKRCDARLHLQPPRVAPWRRPMQRASLFLRGIAMKKVPLTQGKLALVDDCDFVFVMSHKWCAHKIGNTFYAAGWINKRLTHMHRFIMGPTVESDIDHINGNGLDNRRENLHAVSHSFNLFQSPKKPHIKGQKPSSMFKGVGWDKRRKRWRARFSKGGLHLGTFQDEKEAARAYDNKIIEVFGLEKSLIGNCLNFKEEHMEII
jgi:AP2 domain